jgi:hypothetical protein
MDQKFKSQIETIKYIKKKTKEKNVITSRMGNAAGCWWLSPVI